MPVGWGRHRVRDGVRWILASFVVAMLVGLYFWRGSQEQDSVRAMPEPERRALYERTLVTLRSVCNGSRGEQLWEFCREQADFIVTLPECDASCRALADVHLDRPTR